MSVASIEASGRPLQACPLQDGWHDPLPDGMICVGRLQPDLVLVSQSLLKIAIVEVSRPKDGSSEQLTAVLERKMRTYAPLLEALKVYLDEGWQVEILPWVVGVCGLLDSETITCCLEFLGIQRRLSIPCIAYTAKLFSSIGCEQNVAE